MSFHVNFGFNETPLTSLLERRCFDAAEELIRGGTAPLDDGCYQRTPLYIILSGEQSAHDGEPCPRNLYLARLLVQEGADVNNRVPRVRAVLVLLPGKIL
jgi:hypothetical protein